MRDALIKLIRFVFGWYPALCAQFCPDGVERKALGEVADFKYGYTVKAQDEGKARFIRITDINENGYLEENGAKFVDVELEENPYLLTRGDLVMARTGATFGKTLYYDSDEPAIFASFLIKISLNPEIVLPRYYWHFAQSTIYWNQANKLVSPGGQQQFNSNALKKVVFPIPPLEFQRAIVEQLDAFDSLCNDLCAGLPAEIDARRKEYEYYRDKLLTFKPRDEEE